MPQQEHVRGVRYSHLWGARNDEFFGHRLQTSMTRATAEDSTAGLGQTSRTGRALVGGLSFHGVSELCMDPWRTGCQEEFRPSA